MTTYKEIRGTQIEAVATDPSNPVEGQVWYNTTSNVLKGQAAATTAAWSTGGNLNTARSRGAGAGTKGGGLLFGGDPLHSETESYNGTSWTEVSDLNTARGDNAGAGTYTSALSFGGEISPGATGLTESWDGASWTEVADLNTARDYFGGSGQ